MRCVILLNAILLPCLALAADAPPKAERQPVAAMEAGTQLTLDECVSIALLNHPGLAEASARIDESRGAVVQARLYPNPRIDSGNPQTIGPQRTGVYTVGLTQEIVRGGKLRLDQAAAYEASRQTEWDSVRRRFEILTDVRQEFFSLLAAQRRLTFLEKQQQLAKRSEKIVSDRLEGLQAARVDLVSMRVERRRVDVALQSAKFERKRSRRQLATTLGIADSQIQSVTGDLMVAVPAFDDDQVLTEVIQNSPVVQIAKLDVSRTMFLLHRAEVEPIPNVTVQGGTQYSESTNNFQGLLGVYVNVPIWNKNQGNIHSANAAVRRATAMRQVVEQNLTKQLTAAVTRFHEAENTVTSYEDGIIPDATEALNAVQAGFVGGQFDLTRLLQAQSSYFDANLDFVSALQGRLNAASEIAGLLQLEKFP